MQRIFDLQKQITKIYHAKLFFSSKTIMTDFASKKTNLATKILIFWSTMNDKIFLKQGEKLMMHREVREKKTPSKNLRSIKM